MAARFVTIEPSGGDYTSLSAAEAGEQAIGADLVSAGDTLEMQYQGDWSGGADTTAATISGFTTGASNWIKVSADSSNAWTGTAWSTTKARLVANSGSGIIIISNNFVTVVGLQIENTGTGSGVRMNNASPLVDNCLLRARRGAHLNNAAVTLLMRNCLGVDGGTQVMRQLVHAEISGSSGRVYASTYAGTGSSSTECGFEAETGATLVLTNCIGNDTTVGAVIFGGAGTLTQSYNASSDATAAGTGSITSATFTFVNAGAGDYRIDGADTSGVIGGGTDLSADANLPVTLDAGGQTRPAAPTMGMWEVNPAGGTSDYGISTETDSAVALVGSDHAAYGVATETGAAVALVGSDSAAYGVATETDAAVALVDDSGTFYGIATETDLAVALVGSDSATYGVTTETGAAVALVGSVLASYGAAAETDTALALVGSVAASYGIATETDQARALAVPTVSIARVTGTLSAIVPGASATISYVVPGAHATVATH